MKGNEAERNREEIRVELRLTHELIAHAAGADRVDEILDQVRVAVEKDGRDLGTAGQVAGGHGGIRSNVVVLALQSSLQQRDHVSRVKHRLLALLLHAGHSLDDIPGPPLELHCVAGLCHILDCGEAGRLEDGSSDLPRRLSEPLATLQVPQLNQKVDGGARPLVVLPCCCRPLVDRLVPSPQKRLDGGQKSRLLSYG